jgi:hypothetical protein
MTIHRLRLHFSQFLLLLKVRFHIQFNRPLQCLLPFVLPLLHHPALSTPVPFHVACASLPHHILHDTLLNVHIESENEQLRFDTFLSLFILIS